MTPRTFLVYGLLAGLFAGIAAFLVAHELGEPQVDVAIAVEEDHSAHEESAPAGQTHEEDGTVVSRDNQSTWGLATGTLSMGLVIGGIVGLVAAGAVGRIGRLRPGQSTALVAVIGFGSVVLIPFLKYPATPPAVGNPDTVGARTNLYFGYVALSLVTAIAATLVARRLLPGLGTYRTVLVAVGGYLLVVVVAGLLMPTVNETGDFPASTLWYFRRSSLITLATLWGGIGIVLTGLVGRAYQRETVGAARREVAASL